MKKEKNNALRGYILGISVLMILHIAFRNNLLRQSAKLRDRCSVHFHKPFQNEAQYMTILETGCCGAYCKTCPESRNARCRGCKIGYAEGKRDLKKARCKMKVCCLEKGLDTCADCDQYATCGIIQGFYSKKGYKYKKYEEATLFIRKRGYGDFLAAANGWKNQYGKLE